MKKIRVLAVISLLCLLLAIFPVTAFAAEDSPIPEDWAWVVISVEGPASLTCGGSATYDAMLTYQDADLNLITKISDSYYWPADMEWYIVSDTPVAAGTTIVNSQGYGVLTIDPAETASSITIMAYDVVYEIGEQYTISLTSAPAAEQGSLDASTLNETELFWLGVHAQISAAPAGATITVNADGYTYVPYFIFDILRGTNKSVSISVGNDIFVLTGAGAGKLVAGSSYSFLNLSGISTVTSDNNARGGCSYKF